MPESVTMVLGRHRLPELRQMLRQAGVRHNAYGEQLLPRVPIALCARPVQVVVHTLASLGWPEGSELAPVLAALPARGLAPCPHEVALLLRLAWKDRAIEPRIAVLSPRLDADELAPRGFYLSEADGPWLRAYVASDDWVFAPTERVAVLVAG